MTDIELHITFAKNSLSHFKASNFPTDITAYNNKLKTALKKMTELGVTEVNMPVRPEVIRQVLSSSLKRLDMIDADILAVTNDVFSEKRDKLSGMKKSTVEAADQQVQKYQALIMKNIADYKEKDAFVREHAALKAKVAVYDKRFEVFASEFKSAVKALNEAYERDIQNAELGGDSSDFFEKELTRLYKSHRFLTKR